MSLTKMLNKSGELWPKGTPGVTLIIIGTFTFTLFPAGLECPVTITRILARLSVARPNTNCLENYKDLSHGSSVWRGTVWDKSANVN